MKVIIDGLEVIFPHEYIYKEQYSYMCELKRALDAKGHCMLEMPTGTGKTVCLLSFVLAYKASHPQSTGKLIYCTRTVPEMSKCILELKKLVKYREQYYEKNHKDVELAANTDKITTSTEEQINIKGITAVCLSSRRNLCINPEVMSHTDGEKVDAICRSKTASWVRAKAGLDLNLQETPPLRSNSALCDYFEEYDKQGFGGDIPPGIYSLDDLKQYGKEKKICPYYLTRHVLSYADVIVYNYQYMLDSKVAATVSRHLERECIIVFDEAHNIDNVCIESLSVELNRRSLDRASRNLSSISNQVSKLKQEDKSRLDSEYRRLVESLRSSSDIVSPIETSTDGDIIRGSEITLGNPVLPDDILDESIPGNIRKADHFVSFMRRLVEYLKTRIRVQNVESETPQAFLYHLNQAISMETKPMKYCYSRINSLLRTLEVTNLEEFNPILAVADFATLVATYTEGFMLIIEPSSESVLGNSDPILRLACLDASLAIRPVFERFNTVIITSGTLSPIDLYPRILNFNPVVRESLSMSIYRSCICPLIVTRGSDQMVVSTKFNLRDDMSVVRNYAALLLEMVSIVPDGIVCFFPSYTYLADIIAQWDSLGVLNQLLNHKLLFIETKDIVETTLALDSFKRACDCGRGAVFLSVARGKVAEGIDFDRHYGRCVIMFGIPFQYTLSHVLRARLEYLRYTHQIKEGDFLTFDALRQAAQCAGRVVRSKNDYGIIIFADSRYNRYDKRNKLPPWILQFLVDSHLNLSVDMAVHISKRYLQQMAQPVDNIANINSILMDEETINKLPLNHIPSGSIKKFDLE